MSDEAFVPDVELIETKDSAGNVIGVSTESGNPVEWTDEDTYKFRLSSFQDDLKYWLKDGISIHNCSDLMNSFLLKKVVTLIYKTVFRKYSTTGDISENFVYLDRRRSTRLKYF